MKKRSNNIAAELIKGAVAGAISVWVMDRITWYMYRHEDREAYLREKEAQVDGKYVSEVAVDKILDATGKELTDKQQHLAAKGVHYFLGIAPAMFYTVMRHRVKNLNAGGGALFGIGTFVLLDEIIGPAAGLASGPSAYPWQAHARGLVGHLATSAVTDGVLKVLDEALPS